MTTLRNKIDTAAAKANLVCTKKKNIDRVQIFKDALAEQGVQGVSVGDKPAKGLSFFVREMKDCYRVNVRCGYGRHNYAPCVEISKQPKNNTPRKTSPSPSHLEMFCRFPTNYMRCET